MLRRRSATDSEVCAADPRDRAVAIYISISLLIYINPLPTGGRSRVFDVACGFLARAGLEIVSGYDIETLKQISGVKVLTNAEKQQYQQLQLQVIRQQAMARPPGPPAPSG